MLKLELKLEEVNMILAALGKQPFEVVFKVVESIQTQAQAQLSEASTENNVEVVSGAVN